MSAVKYFLTLSLGIIAGALKYIVSEANTNRALRLVHDVFILLFVATEYSCNKYHHEKIVEPC
jgi:hypothetical protein